MTSTADRAEGAEPVDDGRGVEDGRRVADGPQAPGPRVADDRPVAAGGPGAADSPGVAGDTGVAGDPGAPVDPVADGSPTAVRRAGRTAADTRARILVAATAEFADRGLAGGRVDRIAAAAAANKERIYANFGSKEGLFDATVEAIIGELLDSVPFDAFDLPGYAARLYDFTLSHPNLIRLALWYSLERSDSIEELPQSMESTVRKVRALADAQRSGAVDDSVAPERLIPLILGLVQGSLVLSSRPVDEREVAARRDAVRVAVTRLVTPAGPPLAGGPR